MEVTGEDPSQCTPAPRSAVESPAERRRTGGDPLLDKPRGALRALLGLDDPADNLPTVTSSTMYM
jgi:hypothetical protein